MIGVVGGLGDECKQSGSLYIGDLSLSILGEYLGVFGDQQIILAEELHDWA